MISIRTNVGRSRSDARCNRRRKRSLFHQGVAATELACVLPVLMLIVLGGADFGRVAHSRIALSNATGAGASYAATHRVTAATRDAWDDAIRSIVLEEMQGLSNFDDSQLEVATEVVESPDGSVLVAVEARYPFGTVVDWPGLPHQLDLRERVASTQYR